MSSIIRGGDDFDSSGVNTDIDNLQTGLATNTSDIAAISNPNLLINGDFSVWQRGESFSPPGYTADRWRCDSFFSASKDVTLGYPVLRLQSTTQIPYVQQYIEDISSVAGKTVTSSYWAKFTTGDNRSQSYPRNTSGTSDVIPISFAPTGETDSDGFARYSATYQYAKAYSIEPSVRVDFIENTDVLIKDAKLELGDRATPFIPDDPATNLAKCQRYYQSHGKVLASATDNQYRYASLLYPTEMREIPTCLGQYTSGSLFEVTKSSIIFRNTNPSSLQVLQVESFTLDAEL